MMNIKLKAGDIVKIENAYFKNDNGLFFVTHCPEDAGWLGKDYSLTKICKNGKISKTKYNLSSWPLCSFVNNKIKAAEAKVWNEEHATIEKVEGINTAFIIEYFENKVAELTEQYRNYSTRWGEENKISVSYKETLEHYKSVVKRMSCNDVSEAEITVELEETEEIKTSVTLKKERIYYPINEDTARVAKEINSFSEYKQGSATAEYQNYCDKAYDILDKIKFQKPEQVERVEKKVNYYCKKLSQYYNDYYRNEASCPSIMICGAGNFPVKKKNRQNSRHQTLHNTWEYLQNYLRKIENILIEEQPIKSGDSDVIDKLTKKIKQLETEHKLHMNCNRYYKKNGTLKGFVGLTEKEATEIEDFVKRNPVFPPFITYNETANIRRYKKRLKKLIKEKENKPIEQAETDEENIKLFTVMENKEIMRLQILFDNIPSAQVRDILKSNGFKWSPKNKAWQRQLTDNARHTYKDIKNDLKKAMSA